MNENRHTARFPQLDIEFINTKGVPVIIGCTLDSGEKPFSIGPSSNMSEEKKFSSKKLLADLLQTDVEKMIYMHQVHGDGVVVIAKDDDFPSDGKMGPVGECDAVISAMPGSQINLSIADCGGVMMYHPPSNTIAAVHSGWKGTKAGITEKTVEKMAESFGRGKAEDSKAFAEELLVWFMPSAGGKSYEVGEEFRGFFTDSISEEGGKLYFDNRSELTQRLLGMGVKEENIQGCEECTIADKRFHSYRRDGEKSGRMNAFIKLER